MCRNTVLFAVLSLILCLLQDTTEGATCNYNNNNYSVGQSWSIPGRCEQWTCQENGGVIGKTCPVIRDASGKEITGGDLTLPYPACCPRP